MTDQERPQARSIDSFQPDELDQLYTIPAWRIWSRSIFSQGEYREAFDQAAAKPWAVLIHPDRPGYHQAWNRHDEGQPRRMPLLFRGTGTFDRPSFLLEPLTEEEVQKIDELGEVPGPINSVDKPNELFRPEDLKRVFQR